MANNSSTSGLDWYKTIPIIISIAALCIALSSAFSAHKSATNSERSADAAEKSALNSGRSAAAAEAGLEMQRQARTPNAKVECILQTDKSPRLLVRIKNLGASLTVEKWGFSLPEDGGKSTYLAPSQLTVGMPKRLETNDSHTVVVSADDLKQLTLDQKRLVTGIMVVTSIGLIANREKDVTDFLKQVVDLSIKDLEAAAKSKEAKPQDSKTPAKKQ